MRAQMCWDNLVSTAGTLRNAFEAAKQSLSDSWEILVVPERITNTIVDGIPVRVREVAIEIFPSIVQEEWKEVFPAHIEEDNRIILGPQVIDREIWDNILWSKSGRTSVTSIISEKALKNIKKKWGQKGIDAFKKAMNKGMVGSEGQSGIKKLKGNPLKGKYTYEIKVKNKEYGDYRIYGYQDGDGTIIFDYFDKGLH